MNEALALGALFGVGSALSVGPITVTIIHESLTRGLGAGFRVILGSATADLILMLPVLAATWLIAGIDSIALAIAFAGAAYFVFLAFNAVREGRRLWRSGVLAPASAGGFAFAKGVVGNLLNPLTWAFWLATGTPTMLHVLNTAGWPGMLVFTVTWFIVAMAVECVIAIGVSQSRKMLSPRSLAVVQCCSAAMFVAVAATLVVGRTR